MNVKCQSLEIPNKGVGVVAVDTIEVEKKKLLEDALKDMSPKKRKEFWNLHDSKVSEVEEKTAHGIWRTNNFALGVSGPKSNNGLFLEMNSTIHVYQMQTSIGMADDKKLELPGIIITRTLMSTGVLSQNERKKYLYDHYGFPCDCVACSLKGEEKKQDDWERNQIVLLEGRIERLLYDFPTDNSDDISSDNDNDEDACDKDIIVPEGKTDRNNNDNRNNGAPITSDNDKSENEVIPTDAEECVVQGIQLAFHRLELMDKLGFKALSKIRVCRLIYDTALEWDFTDYAEKAAKIGVELARCIYGEQSPKYHRWIQITQDTLDR